MVRVPSSDGKEFSAYMALPIKGRGPGVVVAQEIFGVTDSLKQVCDFLASRQFTAICPDLYWRTEEGVVLKENDYERARAMRAKTDDNQAAADLNATMEFLKKHPACTGRVGIIGYCWGGMLSYLTACRHKPEAAVGYYGVGIENKLDQSANLSCSLMLHYAGKDAYAGPDVRAKVRAAHEGDPKVTILEYPDADHAFARPGGHNFHYASADLADMRTLSFLTEKLFGPRG